MVETAAKKPFIRPPEELPRTLFLVLKTIEAIAATFCIIARKIVWAPYDRQEKNKRLRHLEHTLKEMLKDAEKLKDQV